jgi:hypothetical protein
MHVTGDCRYRQPPSGDVYTLEGFVSTTGAPKAVDPNLSIGNDVEQSVNCLNQIVELARQRGADAGPHMKAAEAATYELRNCEISTIRKPRLQIGSSGLKQFVRRWAPGD